MRLNSSLLGFLGLDEEDLKGNGIVDGKINAGDLVASGAASPEKATLLNGLGLLEQVMDMEAPEDPGKNFNSYLADQGGFKGFMGGVVGEPILNSLFFGKDEDEFEKLKAGYAMDKKRYDSLWDIATAEEKKRRELAVMDPQVEDLAKKLEAEGRVLEAATLRASNAVSAMNYNPIEVSPDERVYSPITNSLLFEGAEKTAPDNRTAAERHADAVLDGLGLKPGDQGYAPARASLVTGFAEPSGYHTTADGQTIPYNTVDGIVDSLSQQYAPPQTTTGNGSNPNTTPGLSGPNGIVTSTMARNATIAKAANEKEATEVAGAQDDVDFWGEVQGVLGELGEWNVDKETGQGKFSAKEQVHSIYGPIDSFWPDSIRGGDEQDAIAQINRLNSLLSVDAREALAGQGQITEGEQAMLTASLSALIRERDGMKFGGAISNELVDKELGRIYAIMEKAQKRAQGRLSPSNTTGGQVGSNDIDSLVDKYTGQ